ncbi:MAG: hypothetical protein LBF34_00065 [Puniceicoccales bacterium]|nr:hypothetical protein [Puniceicoccales bacterium]
MGAAAIAAAGVSAGPLGAVPAQIAVHSDTVAVDKFISYCHNSSLGDFDPAAAAAACRRWCPWSSSRCSCCCRCRCRSCCCYWSANECINQQTSRILFNGY